MYWKINFWKLTFITLPRGSITFDKNNILSKKKFRAGDALKFGVSGFVYSKIYRSARRSGYSRSKARKIANRRRRSFVDNIIMHHKRLHDHNRKLVVSTARDRAVQRKKNAESMTLNKNNNLSLQNQRKEKVALNSQRTWIEKNNIKREGLLIRDKTQILRMRAQSRWASVKEEMNN